MINPLRLDPTRTTLLRRAFVADMHRRFVAVRRAVIELVEVEDAFGLGRPDGPVTVPATATVTRTLSLDAVLPVANFNPNHDPHSGEFSSGHGGVAGAGGKHEAAVAAAVTKHGPILAEGKQDGYTMRIHDSYPGRKNPSGQERVDKKHKSLSEAGRKTIQSPEGEIVTSAKWMDWAEMTFPANYKSLSRPERAALEVEEQKKYGYAKMFKSLKENPITTNTAPVANVRWAFTTDDKKVEAYRAWLKDQVDQKLLTVDPQNQDKPWLQDYIGKAYKKGQTRAYTDVNKTKPGQSFDFIEGGQEAFLKMSFEGPVGQSKLRMLGTRAYANLEGITADMDKQMTTTLTTGLAKGTGPRELARQLTKTVDTLDAARAATLARTEIVHAHNEGQLDAFEAMNVEGVGVAAEWSTAHDGMVCPLCAPLEGVVLTIKEARGMLPRHPNCRCAWIPAGIGEQQYGTTQTTWAGPEQGLEPPGTAPTGKTTGQVWSKDNVGYRIKESLKAEYPKLSTPAARAASRWVGADVTITGKLKPGTKAFLEAKAEAKAAAQIAATAAKEKAAAEAAAKKAEHSLKVKEGLAKKKLGIKDSLYNETTTGAELSLDGIEAYAAQRGVTLTSSEIDSVWGLESQVPGVPNLAAQVEKLITTVDEKIAAKAAAETAQKAAVAAAKAKLGLPEYLYVDFPGGTEISEEGMIKYATGKGVALSNEEVNVIGLATDSAVLAPGVVPLQAQADLLIATVEKKIAAKELAAKEAHSHKTKLGLAKQHYGKEKFGGGVLPGDYTSANQMKLADTGLNKVLSQKGWHLSTLPGGWAEQLTTADDIVAQKKLIDAMPKAGKLVPKVPLPGAWTADEIKAGGKWSETGDWISIKPSPLSGITKEVGDILGVDVPAAVAPTPAALVPEAAQVGVDEVAAGGAKYSNAVHKGSLVSYNQTLDKFGTWLGDEGFNKMNNMSAQEVADLINKFKAENAALFGGVAPTTPAAPIPVPVAPVIDRTQPWFVDAKKDFVGKHTFTIKEMDAALEKGSVGATNEELYGALNKWDKASVDKMNNMSNKESAELLNKFKAVHPDLYPPTPGGKGYWKTDINGDPYWVATEFTVKAPAPLAIPFEGDLKKIKDLPGSTKPYLAADKTGKQWVVKDVEGSGIAPAHLRSEANADELYRTLGYAVPRGKIIDSAGGPMKVTEFLEGGQTLAEWKAGKTEAEVKAMYKEIQKGFVADALFANHDVAGLAYDNIFVVGGKVPYRIDNGGALAYRAQGGAKRGFTGKVTELKTMRDHATNPVTATIYDGITDDTINDQIRHVVANRERLLAAVEDKDIRKVLAARIDDLEARLPAQAPRKAVPGGPRAAEYGVTAQTPQRVVAARANGVNIAVDRADIEDNNVLAWEERDAAGKPVTHLQMKVTKAGSDKIAAALGDELKKAKAMATTAPVQSNVHPDDKYFEPFKLAGKTINHHVKDGKYNKTTIGEFQKAVVQLQEELDVAKGDKKKMLEHYVEQAQALEGAMQGKTTTAEMGLNKVTQYVHKPEAVKEEPDAAARALRRDIRVRRDSAVDFRTVKFENGVGVDNGDKNRFSTDQAYVLDMGEGIQAHYVPNDGKFDRDSGRALHGTVRVTVPAGATPETLNKAMGMMKEIGLNTTPPSEAYEEALYLHRGVYINKKSNNATYKAIWENKNITDEERVVQQKKWILDNMKIDVAKVPNYNPAGVTKHADGSGYRHWERWDLPVDKVEKDLKNYTLHHNPSRGTADVLGAVLDSGGEFTSTTGRIRKGVNVQATGGMSSESDINTGGASYFFTRIQRPGSTTRGFHFKIGNLARQDAISYNEDEYGAISQLAKRGVTIHDYKEFATRGSNESIFKEGLSLTDLDVIVANDTDERKAILSVFKQRGVKKLPDGRSIEDIVVTTEEKRKRL